MEKPREQSKPLSIGKKIRYIFLLLGLSTIIGLTYLISGSFGNKEPFISIPIHFTETRIPCIEVAIESNKYLFEVDLGGDFYFSINKTTLQKIVQKTPCGFSRSSDVKGNIYSSPIHTVPEIAVNKIKINNVPVVEEQLEFLLEGAILSPSFSEQKMNDRLKISGRIGNRFFKRLDYLLIDFPKATLVAIRDIEQEKKNSRFLINDFVTVNLETLSPLLFISVDTDLGTKKFALDTGASRSILNTPKELKDAEQTTYTTSYFKIGGNDFGQISLYLFQISPSFNCDGFIGRDFFDSHPVYLDFKNQKALIPI